MKDLDTKDERVLEGQLKQMLQISESIPKLDGAIDEAIFQHVSGNINRRRLAMGRKYFRNLNSQAFAIGLPGTSIVSGPRPVQPRALLGN